MEIIKYFERPTRTTYGVSTTVETTPYGNVLINRTSIDPLAHLLGGSSSLLSPAAARQLIGALEEALSTIEAPPGAPLSRTGDNTGRYDVQAAADSRWTRFMGGIR